MYRSIYNFTHTSWRWISSPPSGLAAIVQCIDLVVTPTLLTHNLHLYLQYGGPLQSKMSILSAIARSAVVRLSNAGSPYFLVDTGSGRDGWHPEVGRVYVLGGRVRGVGCRCSCSSLVRLLLRVVVVGAWRPLRVLMATAVCVGNKTVWK